MNKTLDRFQIVGLHGKKNIDVRFYENTLILVGENGSGRQLSSEFSFISYLDAGYHLFIIILTKY